MDAGLLLVPSSGYATEELGDARFGSSTRLPGSAARRRRLGRKKLSAAAGATPTSIASVGRAERDPFNALRIGYCRRYRCTPSRRCRSPGSWDAGAILLLAVVESTGNSATPEGRSPAGSVNAVVWSVPPWRPSGGPCRAGPCSSAQRCRRESNRASRSGTRLRAASQASPAPDWGRSRSERPQRFRSAGRRRASPGIACSALCPACAATARSPHRPCWRPRPSRW